MKAGRRTKARQGLQSVAALQTGTADVDQAGSPETPFPPEMDLTTDEVGEGHESEVAEKAAGTQGESPELRALVQEFVTLHRQQQRDDVETVCILGEKLLEMRALTTEAFDTLVNDRLPVSRATAYRYIGIAELNKADANFVDYWKSIGVTKMGYLTYMKTAEERAKTLAPYRPADLERMSQPAVAALVGYQGKAADEQLGFEEQSKVYRRFIRHANFKVKALLAWIEENPGKKLDEDLIQEFDALKVAVFELRKLIR